MPRDLFSASVAGKAGPRRSTWTIAGSLVAHITLLAALLVLPVVSALDSYVVQARNISFAPPPAPVMPAIPARPPQSSTPQLNPNAAPPEAVANPIEPNIVPPGGAPGLPGLQPPIGEVGPGVLRGTGPVNVLQPPAPPPAVPPKPVRVGGDISTPTRISYVNPVYPEIAIKVKASGTVTLEATIDEHGVVRDVTVLGSVPLLDQAAIDAVKRWRYTPTRLNGVAVPVLLTVRVTFTLR